MISISQAIVVEGRYDKNTLSQIVDAPIFETSGFHIMKDRAMQALLRNVAAERGLIVFTDSDGGGFVIRNFLKQIIPAQYLFHAYIPDIYGKEKRKTAPGKEGKLGVEGMSREVLLQVLADAGAVFEDNQAPTAKTPITKADFYELGLTGQPDSKTKRLALLKKLNFPEHMSANAMLEALNVLYGREKFFEEML